MAPSPLVVVALVHLASANTDEQCMLQLPKMNSNSAAARLATDHPDTYVGCFVDDGNRDLEVGPRAYGHTTETCSAACQGYNFFALQNNGWCVCGNAYSTESQYVQAADSDCGGPCAGESNGRCGGPWRNAIYNVVHAHPDTYVGCFVDDGNRDLEVGPRAYGHTTETCSTACQDYNFFALQNNGWCVCGNAYSTESQYVQVTDSDCRGPCNGESNGRCGGPWRNAVYLVHTLWSQHLTDAGRVKCNNNVDMEYVADQAACQSLALQNGHAFYSFRHNGEEPGHKCMSSATCDSPLTNRHNDWAIYKQVETQCLGTFQAEDATLGGDARVHANTASANHQGFTGSSFVDYISPSDDFVEWTLSGCSGGEATASFRYALASGNRPLQVLVNNEEVAASLSFPASGAWNQWAEASLAVPLSAGTNVVRLVATGVSGANMDSLSIA